MILLGAPTEVSPREGRFEGVAADGDRFEISHVNSEEKWRSAERVRTVPVRRLGGLTATLREGIGILRTEGPIPFLQAGLRAVNLNYRGFYYYLGYHYKRLFRRDIELSDPFTVIDVDPSRVRRAAPRNIDRWRHMGEVRSGEWDRSSEPLASLPKYRSVVDRFERGVPWEETDIYQEAIERIQAGEPHWNGCRTVDAVERRTEHVDRLYETIREEGFKSQAELRGADVRSTLLSGRFDRSKTDVTVAIGRDGTILFVDGNHRLAIAHTLDLLEIPVRVVVRHDRWQAIRNEVRLAESVDRLSDAAKRHLDHPDVPALPTA